MVIEWTHQIRDVLQKDSAEPILDGLNPTPFFEIEFWKNKALNLECIYDQVLISLLEYSCALLYFRYDCLAILTHRTGSRDFTTQKSSIIGTIHIIWIRTDRYELVDTLIYYLPFRAYSFSVKGNSNEYLAHYSHWS